MVTFSLASYEDYKFPVWADWIGVLIGISTLVPLPVMAAYVLFQRKYVSTSKCPFCKMLSVVICLLVSYS